MPAEGAMQTEAEAPATEPLSLTNVTRRYRRVTALEGIGLSVRQDEVLAVVGPSGCGKSTLLELMAGLQEADEGTVSAAGATDAAGRRAACAYMPQRDLLLPWRDAPARGLPPHAASWPPRAAPRRALRRARLDHPRVDAALARGGAGPGAADGAARDPRRRGG